MHLVDCVKRNEAHPDTFELPDPEVLDAMAVGDWAKLIWESDEAPLGEPTGERMWVRVTQVEAQDGEPVTYHGELDNLPVVFTSMGLGTPVTFERRHVAQVTLYDAVKVLADELGEERR